MLLASIGCAVTRRVPQALQVAGGRSGTMSCHKDAADVPLQVQGTPFDISIVGPTTRLAPNAEFHFIITVKPPYVGTAVDWELMIHQRPGGVDAGSGITFLAVNPSEGVHLHTLYDRNLGLFAIDVCDTQQKRSQPATALLLPPPPPPLVLLLLLLLLLLSLPPLLLLLPPLMVLLLMLGGISFAGCTTDAQILKCKFTTTQTFTVTAKGSQVGNFTSSIDVRDFDAIYPDVAKANVTISDLPRETCAEWHANNPLRCYDGWDVTAKRENISLPESGDLRDIILHCCVSVMLQCHFRSLSKAASALACFQGSLCIDVAFFTFDPMQ
jgi:hypothetical protein